MDEPGSSQHRKTVELVQRCLNGSIEAKDELAERLACVHRFAYHRNRQLGARLSSDELADLAQDVLAVVWGKLAQYNGRASLETWVFRITSLETMNFLRKDRRHTSRFVETGVDEDGNKSLDWIVDPQSQKSTNQDFEGIYRGMSQLSTDDQLILRRKHYGRQSSRRDAGRERRGTRTRQGTAPR